MSEASTCSAPRDESSGPLHPTNRMIAAELALPEPTAPEIFTAIQERLGLKLVPDKGPGDFLVIDHIEEPTPN